MHTVWKGAISFGLVHVPVKMFSATEDKDISMRMIHKPCSTPLSYVRKCQTCETEVPWEEIVKGYEHEPGRFVIFDKEELEQLSGEKSKEIKILDFVQLGEIDPVYFQKTYYLAPADTGSNAYNLLLRSLTETGKIGIAKVSIRSKSSLAAIRVVDRCLALETIFYPDEIRPISQVPNLPEQANVNDKELTMAKMLIDQLSTPFEPEKYTDEYRSAVYEAISRKVAGEEIQVAPEQQRTNVIDLMSALEASLEAARSGAKPGGTAAAKTPGTTASARRSASPSPASAPTAGEPASPAEAGGMTGTEDAKPKRGRPRKSSKDVPSKETL
ncbi:Ku protein [Paenibacillus mesotrionivorans]|jgi:DNA end-binding protein Ku|uniref:Ku protein n=1 Tax=Paenibacillus mesotrionivorans TaxID=3160968 RepID=A0ACC7P381_9BACL